MVWKNQGLIDSTTPKFGEGQSDIGPVNKLQPMQGGFKSGSNTPGLWDRAKGLFTPTTSSVAEGGAGGSASSGTYAQYFGIAALGLAVGDLAGSVYNKRKAKRKK